MKRIIVICLLALTAAYGCQVNELVEVDSESKSFTASIEDNCTKTSLDDQGNVLFKQGDRMSIFVGSTINEQYQVTDDSDGKTSASLIKVAGPGFVAGGEIDNNIAFYPYASAITIARNGNAFVLRDITLPSTQNYAAGSFGNGAFPMAAVTSNAEDMHLKFKNVLGGVKLQLTGTGVVKSVSIRGNGNEILCGAAEVTVSSTSTPTISLTDASAKTVTLDCGDGVQLNNETATSFIIALPPMTMEGGFTVVVTDTEGKQMEVSTSRPQAITRSNLLKMPVVSFTGSTPVEEHNYTLSIYTPTTKTSLSDNLMTWVAGDKFFFSDGVSSEVCTIPDNFNGSTTAVVTTHQAFDGEVYCIYPGDAVTQDGDDFYVDIPENQNTDGSAFMVLSGNATSDNITLFLRTALMKVSFLSNIEDVAFTSITVEGAPLVGRLKIDELGANVVSGTNTVQVSSDGDNDFYFSVFPGSITGLSVEVYKTDNTYGCKTFSPSVTFEAGRMYSLPINPSTINFRPKPLTITSSGTTSVSISAVGAPDAITLDYKKGASGWTSYTIGNSIDLTDGESLQLRAGAGGNASFSKSFNDYYKFSITGSGTVAASGNIMSLISQEETLVIPSEFCFCNLFSHCSSLTSAPGLPATTLAEGCYEGLFDGCTSMTAAPELPATTLATNCYSSMFSGCTNLTAAPELPATTLVYHCYSSMFRGCTNLNHIKCLATDITATDCLSSWVSGVSPTGVFIKNPDTTWPSGASGIPEGWTVYPTGLSSNAEAVDLDLPSGLKWATLNVSANSIEESGNYYAWGETEPKDYYSWGTYKFELGTDFTGPFSKYVTRPDYGTVDNKTVLDPEDDAAQVNWGGNWRMPTDADWVELMENCTWTWTTDTGTDNGTYGMRVTSNTNGNSIFLPASGSRLGDELSNGGSYGYYWSSTLSQVGSDLPWYVYFSSNGVNREHYGRHIGRSVRPVCE